MNNLQIGIDVDDTLVDTRKSILDMYKWQHPNDTQETKISHNYTLMCPEWDEPTISSLFVTGDAYEYISLIDTSVIDVLKDLGQRHELMICSLHRGEGIDCKRNMLQKLNLLQLFKNEIYLTNVYGNKNNIVFDVFIDDNLNNLRSNHSSLRILFDKYNLYEQQFLAAGIERATNWEEVAAIIRERTTL